MEALLAEEVAEPRFYMIMLGAYGALALSLTVVGIGGVVAYAVSRRTREIGLRVSFGATRSSLLGMFTAGSLKLTAIGLIVGVSSSFVVTRYARTLLYEVTPTDPTTIALVVVVLAGVSVVAAAAAAMRATMIDPANVLRHE